MPYWEALQQLLNNKKRASLEIVFIQIIMTGREHFNYLISNGVKKTKKYFLSVFSVMLMFLYSDIAVAAYEIPSNTGLPNSSGGIRGILANLLTWFLMIFGIIAIISFIVSGIQYFLSAGDEKMMQTAKRNATYSILGVIVALSAFVIIKAVDTALNANSPTF